MNWTFRVNESNLVNCNRFNKGEINEVCMNGSLRNTGIKGVQIKREPN